MHDVHNSVHTFFYPNWVIFSQFLYAGLNYYTMTLNNQKIVNLILQQHRSCTKGLIIMLCLLFVLGKIKADDRLIMNFFAK